MTNVIEFIQKAKAKGVEPPKAFTCSLGRGLLCVQFLALVLEDKQRARDLLTAIIDGDELGPRIELPGEFRADVESTDTARTYRKILGVE